MDKVRPALRHSSVGIWVCWKTSAREQEHPHVFYNWPGFLNVYMTSWCPGTLFIIRLYFSVFRWKLSSDPVVFYNVKADTGLVTTSPRPLSFKIKCEHL